MSYKILYSLNTNTHNRAAETDNKTRERERKRDFLNLYNVKNKKCALYIVILVMYNLCTKVSWLYIFVVYT